MAIEDTLVHCQKSRPNTLGQQGTPISFVTLVHHLQIPHWQGKGQNQELQLQPPAPPRCHFFLILSSRKQIWEENTYPQLGKICIPASLKCSLPCGISLTNDKDTRQSDLPCSAHSQCKSRGKSPVKSTVKASVKASSGQSLAQIMAEQDTTAERCGLFQLIAPSLLWTLLLQNHCLTTTPDNSKKCKERTNVLHIDYTFPVILGAEISPPSTFYYQVSQWRTSPTKCWDYQMSFNLVLQAFRE